MHHLASMHTHIMLYAAQAVMAHVETLIEAGLPAEAIGVITPYNGQVAALRELRTDQLSGVEISSVDGFQGQPPAALLVYSSM